jgi:hypothetical protein
MADLLIKIAKIKELACEPIYAIYRFYGQFVVMHAKQLQLCGLSFGKESGVEFVETDELSSETLYSLIGSKMWDKIKVFIEFNSKIGALSATVAYNGTTFEEENIVHRYETIQDALNDMKK